MTAIAPIIVGVPAGETPPVPRKPPEIVEFPFPAGVYTL